MSAQERLRIMSTARAPDRPPTATALQSGLLSAAERLRALHRGPVPLVLPNVWDPVSARAFADAGFGALATSSAAVAATLGYRDGHTPGPEMLAAVARIARSVSVPVTADIEDGYGMGPAELVARLADAAVVGCNLEDSDPAAGALIDPDRQADFLAAVRAAAGPAVVMNARIDVYVRSASQSAAAAATDEAVARASRYLAAGADCIYPILAPPAALPDLVRRIDGPVNALLVPGGPSIADLAGLGVARITFAARRPAPPGSAGRQGDGSRAGCQCCRRVQHDRVTGPAARARACRASLGARPHVSRAR